MSDLDLTFIGTGNAFAPGGLCWNGFVVNSRYLFEAPPQALMSLNRMGIDPNDIEAVILSHHHGDHMLGLPFLILHWKYRGRTRPVRIIGPPETEVVARLIAERTYPGLFDLPFEIQWVTARPGDMVDVDALQLAPVEVQHDEKLILSLGYACTLDRRQFGYTGDTQMCEAVLDLARHSEVLVTECSSKRQRIPTHMNLVDDMPVVRAAMAPEATLILTHIDAGVEATGLANTFVATDHASYRL